MIQTSTPAPRHPRLKAAWIIFLAAALWMATPRAEAYERIVSFRPNLTEILFALGLGSKVVGVTNFCHYPPEVEKIQKIGGYFNRSLEKVLTLRPDLVVLVPDATTAKIESALARASVETLVLRADSIDDVYDAIRRIADKNAVSERGKALIENLQKAMNEKSARASGVAKKKALLVIQRHPLITAGGKTFLDSLLTLAGGENIAGSSDLPYPQFSIESVISRAPDVIVDFDASDLGNFWARYPSIPAVRNGSVKHLSPDLFIPGPRMPEALDLLITLLHPQ